MTNISRPSLHLFKNTDSSRLIGSEYSYVLQNLELLKESSQSKAALKTATAILCIVSFMKSIMVSPGLATSIKKPELKERVARFVERMAIHIPHVTYSNLRQYSG